MRTYILTAFTALLATGGVYAQGLKDPGPYYRYERGTYAIMPDWEPKADIAPRKTFSILPFYLMQDGLRLDFERETARPGRWLQYSIMGYYKWEYKDPMYEGDGWTSMNTGYDDTFRKLRGAGVGFAYKQMLSRNGWYYSAGVQFNYYDVDYIEFGYMPFTEDGLTFYSPEYTWIGRKFYKPVANVNIGKNFSFNRNAFMDCYIGLGYSHSFHKGERVFDDYMYGFGYRGFLLSGGVRLGFIWGVPKEERRKVNW